IKSAFNYGKNILLERLKKAHIKILEIKEKNEITGDELWIVADSTAEKLKEITIIIEEEEEIGRIYDMDVVDINFQKLSRKSFRKCLICDMQAQDCGRSRRHSVEELQEKIIRILKKYNF
ncbi:MAG: citrate lyase holo-[Fusobacterium sp.]|nr:citrate lyase holo-[acyl-carrier protein] synthase [Fusobacterium sp.]